MSARAPAAAGAGSPRAARNANPFIGTLEITSAPSGAVVAVNNRPVGTTPLVLREWPAGTHAVRVEFPGFARWARAVLVATGAHAKVNATLVKTPEARDVRLPPKE
jgi:hypothetical protein